MPLDYVLGSRVLERNRGAIVRLADDARKCVVFLGFPGDSAEDFDVIGTGFYVSYGSPSQHYLITCGHVAEALKDCPWGIRYNGFDGRADVEHIDGADWVFHPEYPLVDIAVLERDWPNEADGICFPERAFASEFKMETKDFGAGDMVYVSGLFRLLPGRARNQTFVHTGHVAVLPGDELIVVKDWRPGKEGQTIGVAGYVIEVTTLPGSSGSPVFVRRSIFTRTSVRVDGRPSELKTWLYGSVWLLGIWFGAWDAPPGEIYSGLMPMGVRVPVGLGIVSPAFRLIEVLEMPEVKDHRDQERARRDLERAASPQSEPPTTDENPDHREDFSRLLDAAVPGNKSDR